MSGTERLDGRTLACIGTALLTWSSAYASIAYALPSFTPGEVALARLGIASICFALLLVTRRVPLPARRDWPQLALLGVIGLTVYHLCLNYAETRIASGTASILLSLIPAATAAVSAIWLRERLPARTLTGLGIALLGVVLVVLASGKSVKFQPMALLALVSVIASAIYFVGQKPLFARNSMLGVTAFTFFVGYLAWNAALRRTSASQVSSFIYFSPPIAVLIGMLWLHEQPGVLTLVGGVITILGVVLANTRRRAATAAPAVMAEP
jgi:drug/metabolite transporter (DMT)-like permease